MSSRLISQLYRFVPLPYFKTPYHTDSFLTYIPFQLNHVADSAYRYLSFIYHPISHSFNHPFPYSSSFCSPFFLSVLTIHTNKLNTVMLYYPYRPVITIYLLILRTRMTQARIYFYFYSASPKWITIP